MVGEHKDLSLQPPSTIYLSLGSNISPKTIYLSKAIKLLESYNLAVTQQSSIYETPPVGFESSSYFLNLCLECKTNLNWKEVIKTTQNIEKKLGKIHFDRKIYNSRTIDIDIIFFDQKILNTEKLTLPHPRYADRKFVLKPLSEIAPKLICPIRKQTIKELLAVSKDKSIVTRYN